MSIEIVDPKDFEKLPPESKVMPLKLYGHQELVALDTFMHSDFLCSGRKETDRHGGIEIEAPPESICDPALWCGLLNIVFLPEISELHPKFQRTPLIVRFADELVWKPAMVKIGACFEEIKGEYLVRINLKSQSGHPMTPAAILYALIHEICEKDFWLKSSAEEIAKAKRISGEEIKLLKDDAGSEMYNNLLDEKIANRRAARALKRAWPSFNVDFYPEIYPEDK